MQNDLTIARSHAFHLARTLMVPVTLFETDGFYGCLPTVEIDEDDDLTSIHEFNPFEFGPAN